MKKVPTFFSTWNRWLEAWTSSFPTCGDYVKTFEGSSITTAQWQSHLNDYFERLSNGPDMVKKLEKVDWKQVRQLWNYAHEQWLHGDGLDLCVDMQYDDSLSRPVSFLILTLSHSPIFPLTKSASSSQTDGMKAAIRDLSQFSPSDVADFSLTQKGAELLRLCLELGDV